jgi:hypothetical protein
MTLADEINRMILKVVTSLEITSASPGHINNVIQATQMDKPDLEALITKGGSDDDLKKGKKIDVTLKKVEKWDNGNIGELNRFTSQQFGNLKEFISNPAAFVIQSVFRKFAKGLGIIAFALIIFEAVKWIISELLKPGRMLDRRFKRDITQELLAFRRRADQQKIKQGLTSIIITTGPRLRGGQGGGQVVNSLDLVRTGEIHTLNIGMMQIQYESAGPSLSKAHGRRSFGGPGG